MLLILNNITSAVLIILCWWLAHQNGKSTEPYGLGISIGYGAIGIMTTLIAFYRNLGLEDILPFLQLGAKTAIAATFALVACRLHKLYHT